jgi:hypothetical protein
LFSHKSPNWGFCRVRFLRTQIPLPKSSLASRAKQLPWVALGGPLLFLPLTWCRHCWQGKKEPGSGRWEGLRPGRFLAQGTPGEVEGGAAPTSYQRWLCPGRRIKGGWGVYVLSLLFWPKEIKGKSKPSARTPFPSFLPPLEAEHLKLRAGFSLLPKMAKGRNPTANVPSPSPVPSPSLNCGKFRAIDTSDHGAQTRHTEDQSSQVEAVGSSGDCGKLQSPRGASQLIAILENQGPGWPGFGDKPELWMSCVKSLDFYIYKVHGGVAILIFC